MRELERHVRWIGGRPVEVYGWQLAQGDTREQATAAVLSGDHNPNAGNWSGIELWRRVEGGYVAFQTRMRRDKACTYVISGPTLKTLWNKVLTDFESNVGPGWPTYWSDVWDNAVRANEELDKEAV